MRINGINPIIFMEVASIISRNSNSRNYVSHSSHILRGRKHQWTLYSRVNEISYTECKYKNILMYNAYILSKNT
jgi:hypothetical protein